MSDFQSKVKTLLDKVYSSVEKAEPFTSERYENDYMDSLLTAQERGEISNLRFSASQNGLVASFSIRKNSVA